MTNKFALYRFIAPFRSRLQNRLRAERTNVDVDAFAHELGLAERHPEIARFLWEILRGEAFVPDFRPASDDSLSKVYAMGPDEVRDDVIEPLLARLGLSVDGIDFTGFDFSSVATPKDVGRFVVKVADAQNGTGERRFTDIAR